MQVYWNVFGENYRNLAPPLKPSVEDVAVVEDTLARWHRGRCGRKLDALLCGVTPALAALRFPAPTRLLAVDRSEPMIRAIWPGNDASRGAVRASWLALPCAGHRCDIVVGDACFNCMDFPLGYRALCAALHEVLLRDGIVVMRFFVRPERREDLDAVFADLDAARIPSFHIFKWRLAMALQESTSAGIVVNDIYEAWAARGIGSQDLAARLDWPESAINTINAYRGMGTRFSFPTVAEVRETLTERFEEVLFREPGYAFGERCPMFAVQPRERHGSGGTLR